MEENLERKMREHEIRLKMRIHSYGRACLDLIQKDMDQKFKFIFVQLEHFQYKSKDDERLLNEYCDTIYKQQWQISELKTWAKWDEIAHQRFKDDYEANGLKIRELNRMSIEGLT